VQLISGSRESTYTMIDGIAFGVRFQ